MLRPKYITIDCHSTLINNPYAEWSRRLYSGKLSPMALDAFIKDFRIYRFDEAMGTWKPFLDNISSAAERACRKHGLVFDPADAQRIYDDIPNWMPHPDVPAGLRRLAREFPLVGLTNAMDSQITSNIEKMGAPFHAVITAEQVKSYKPRIKGFEDMLDQLGAKPDEILHVSSSFRYDLLPATDVGIRDKVWVNRMHEPVLSSVVHHEVADIGGLADFLGLPAARR